MRAFVVGNYMNANFLNVDRLPQPGESLAARGVFREHGGKGLNLAIGLHRLGVETDLLMAVGMDSPGADVIAYLDGIGMRTAGVLRLPGASGFGVGFVAPDGSNFLAAYQGANALLSATHVAAAGPALRDADIVLAQFEAPEAAILAAFQAARSAGIPTYLNPSPWRATPEALWAATSIIVVNAVEAAALFAAPEAAGWSLAQWQAMLPRLAMPRGWDGDLVVVTLDSRGAVALRRDGASAAAPAFAIRQIDATGAGDAFGAGLVWSLLRDCPLDEALVAANACGAIIAAGEGILERFPDVATLEAFRRSAQPSSLSR